MNNLKFQSKILEVYYANDIFRFRFLDTEKSALSPVQKAYTAKVPANVLNALISRLYETIDLNYSPKNVKNIGKLLYKQLIPDELSGVLYKRDQAITIVSEDYSIPWELLHDGEDFLGTKHSIGRCLIWNLRSDHLVDAFKNQKSCLIISNPTEDLPEAEAEAVILMDFLRRKGITCSYLARSQATMGEILFELGSGQYDFIHYSGHIIRESKRGECAFALADGEILPMDSVSQLSIGQPFVFLNGCGTGRVYSSGNSSGSETSIEGAAISFLNAGASAVVATLWKVSDTGACEFAESVYSLVLDGASIGEALMVSRKKMQAQHNDSTWTSFILYGNPGLCIINSSPELVGPTQEKKIFLEDKINKRSKSPVNRNVIIAAVILLLFGLIFTADKLLSYRSTPMNSAVNTQIEKLHTLEKAFPDPVFREEIIKCTGKPESAITLEVLENIYELDIIGKGVDSLEGIQYLVNLRRLNVDDNNISDLEPLAGLQKLIILNINKNKITDISPIKNLENLQELYLNQNKITSGTRALADLKKLSKLNLDETGIRDISFLSGLTTLTSLGCGRNKVDDISVISQLKNLEHLYLWGGNISDIQPLVDLDHLTELNLGANRISDLTPLSKLTNLEIIDLRYNRIKNVDPIAGLTNLQELKMEGNDNIKSFEPLKSIYNKLSYKDFDIH